MSEEFVEDGAAQGSQGLSGPSMEFIMIRHGETEWNALGKMQGQSDIDLNEAGREQAEAVAERLSKEPNICSTIYSSDLKRAVDTAQTIASKCGGLEVVKEQNFRERHLGFLQGVVYHKSLSEIYPEAHDALVSGQEIAGGGESHDYLFKRCTSSLLRIAEKHRGRRVIVVTHGEVLRALYQLITNCSHGKIGNTAVCLLQLSEGEKWSIKSFNDTTHLKGTRNRSIKSFNDTAHLKGIHNSSNSLGICPHATSFSYKCFFNKPFLNNNSKLAQLYNCDPIYKLPYNTQPKCHITPYNLLTNYKSFSTFKPHSTPLTIKGLFFKPQNTLINLMKNLLL